MRIPCINIVVGMHVTTINNTAFQLVNHTMLIRLALIDFHDRYDFVSWRRVLKREGTASYETADFCDKRLDPWVTKMGRQPQNL
jgi:hypothetical protein